MKILLDKEYELKMSSVAVETIEEHFNKDIEEVIKTVKRAKDINLIVWACMVDAPTLEETKEMFKKYTYAEMIGFYSQILGGDPNVEGAEVTENE